ncbi:MAG: SsrA-binding protein SmpB [Acidobacteria bacterium]|nr:SsrA-binding protein SmpB [Acidobacteriota bacterium]
MPRPADKDRQSAQRNLAVNRQARHDYEIAETFEAGLALLGTEVKSAREGRVQIKDAYARVKDGEVWLIGLHIAPYSHASADNHDPERTRKVLLHRHEIRRLIGKTERAGFTLIPLRVYASGPWIKVELALARGRARHEKKESLRKKIEEREMREAVRRR